MTGKSGASGKKSVGYKKSGGEKRGGGRAAELARERQERMKATSAKAKRTKTPDKSANARTEKVGRVRAPVDEESLLRHHGITPQTSRCLGEGSYGYVRKATRDSDGAVVAVKVINRTKASSRFLKTFLPRELTLTATLKHPNLVACHDHFQNERYTCLVMELMPKGDLEQYISLHGAFRDKGHPKDEFRYIMRDILNGVAYLHSKNVCHRDLKLENVLLGHKMVAKVADLGYGRMMNGDILSETYCGSKAYAAPEILNQTPYKGPPIDCWSMGIILYVVISGAFPFDERDHAAMIKAQKESAFYLNSTVFKSQSALLIRDLLTPNPDNRISATNALLHPALVTS